MNKENIVFIFPRGEAIKNFVLSGTAQEVRKSFRLVIYSVFPNEEFKLLLENSCDEFHSLPSAGDDYSIDWTRSQLNISHGKWLWSGAAKMRWALRDKESKSLKDKVKRLSNKFVASFFANKLGLQFLENRLIKLYIKKWSNGFFEQEFKRLKPVLVFNASHIHCEDAYPVMYIANKLGLKTVTFLYSWDNLTSQGRIIPSYNHYMVWNDQIKKDLLTIYPKINSSQVTVTGTPQFDFHFKKEKIWSNENYCNKIGADPNRPIILYTTGMLNLMPYEEMIVAEYADYLLTLPNKPQLVVRVYPKDKSNRYEQLKKERKDIIFPHIPWETKFLTPLPEDSDLLTNMLYHCDIGVNVASTVTLELAMFHKSTINIGFNPPNVDISPLDYSIYYSWDHYKPITDSNCFYLAKSFEDLKRFTLQGLENPLEKSKNQDKLIESFFGSTLDGKAYQRIADCLTNLASSN